MDAQGESGPGWDPERACDRLLLAAGSPGERLALAHLLRTFLRGGEFELSVPGEPPARYRAAGDAAPPKG